MENATKKQSKTCRNCKHFRPNFNCWGKLRPCCTANRVKKDGELYIDAKGTLPGNKCMCGKFEAI